MLPVVIYEPDAAARTQWMKIMEDLTHREYPQVKLELTAGGERELQRVLDAEDGIMLAILTAGGSPDSVERSIRMFSGVMERNRDNYAVLCVQDAALLGTVVSRCMRPAGILMAPLQTELVKSVLRRILNDYVALYHTEDDAEYMVVNSGKTAHRIAYRDIQYLEAQDKLLNINTGRQIITVRGSLNSLGESLPEGFVRCHRSYIVNRTYIDRLNLPEMELYLTSQERLPISRSYKDTLRESLRAEGWT